MENSIFESREAYFKMVDGWKQNCSYTDENGNKVQSKISYIDFALYAALRGRDWRKILSPKTREDIIKDIEHTLLKRDPNYISLSMFNGTITPEDITKLREIGIKKWSEM